MKTKTHKLVGNLHTHRSIGGNFTQDGDLAGQTGTSIDGCMSGGNRAVSQSVSKQSSTKSSKVFGIIPALRKLLTIAMSAAFGGGGGVPSAHTHCGNPGEHSGKLGGLGGGYDNPAERQESAEPLSLTQRYSTALGGLISQTTHGTCARNAITKIAFTVKLKIIFATVLRKVPVSAGLVALPFFAACGGGGGGGGVGGIAEPLFQAVSQSTGGTSGVGVGTVSIGQSAPRQSTFFSNTISQDISDALASQGTSGASDASIVSQVSPSSVVNMGRTSSDAGNVNLSEGVLSYKGRALQAKNFEDRTRSSNLLIIGEQQSSSQGGGGTQAIRAPGRQDPVVSPATKTVVTSAAETLTGTAFAQATGTYAYEGAFIWMHSDDFNVTVSGSVNAYVRFEEGGSDFTLHASTADDPNTDGSERSRLEFGRTNNRRVSGQYSIPINRSTGRFAIDSRDFQDGDAKSANGFQAGASNAPWMHFTLHGQFGGLDAEAVSGLFVALEGADSSSDSETDGALRKFYVGGVVASGAEVMTTQNSGDNGAGIGRVPFALNGIRLDGSSSTPTLAQMTQSYITSPSYNLLYSRINAPSSNADDPLNNAIYSKVTRIVYTGAGAVAQVVDGLTLRKSGFEHGTREDGAVNLVPVTRYDDPNQSAAILLVDGSDQDDFDTFIVAGGKAFAPKKSGPNGTVTRVTGSHRYIGAQLVGPMATLHNAARSTITLDLDFDANTFTYATDAGQPGLVVAGSGNVDQTEGTIVSGESGSVNVADQNATAILKGRFTGQWQGISGVFSTLVTTGTQVAGGFVAYRPDTATSVRNFNDDAGVVEASNVNVGSGGVVHHASLVTANAANLVGEANDLSTTATSLIASITPDFGNTTPTPDVITGSTTPGGYGVLVRPQATFTYGGQSVNANVYYDRSQQARLVVLHGASNSPAVSAIIAGGENFGGQLVGSYSFEGGYYWASRATPHAITKGRFTLTARFGAAGAATNFAFRASTTQTGKKTSLVFSASQGTLALSSGRFRATGGFFNAGDGIADSSDQQAILNGGFAGENGTSVSGVFATTGASSAQTKQYAGGFVGDGKNEVVTLLEGSATRSGLGTLADRGHGTNTADGIAVVGDDWTTLLVGTSEARDATRDAALLASINPTGFGAERVVTFASALADFPRGTANTRDQGAQSHGGGSYPATQWSNIGGQARLVLLDGSDVDGSGSLIVAGGSARPAASVLTGSFTWAGALVLAQSDNLHENHEFGRFRLKYDFNNAAAARIEGAFNNIPGGDAAATKRVTLNAGVAIDRATGVISKSGTFSLAIAGGKTFDGALSGYVSGTAAQGISGVFATDGTSGVQYAGGFVGGAPRVARDIARPSGADTGGFVVGEAARDVFGTAHDTGNILFLGDNYAARRNAVNVVSDVTRAAQLLSKLGVTLAGGAAQDTFTRYDPVSVSFGGTPTTVTGVAFENSNENVRLYELDGLVVAGGQNIQGSISGPFEYAGVFVSASQGALGTLREGTFDMTANFAAGGTGSFTFTGTTAASGAQTSRLQLASGGALVTATGRITAATATYIQGDGDTRTHDARIEGGIFGVGGTGVAGLFTTTAGSGANHAGGFAGSVLEFASEILTGFDGRSSPADEGFAKSAKIVLPVIGGGATNLFTPDLGNILADVNNSVYATRQGAYLRQFGKSIADGSVTAGTVSGNLIKEREVTGYTYPDAGTAISAKLTQDWLGLAGVLATDATPVSGASAGKAGSLLIAGGAVFTGALSGQYTWVGIQLVGESNALETLTEEAVRITANFTSSGAQTFTVATQGSGKTNDLTGSGSVDVATGALGGGSLALAVGGASKAVSFAGRLHGDRGVTLSGVFANSEALGAKHYAGAILASGARGLSIVAGVPHGTRVTSAPVIARGDYDVNGHGAAQGALFLVPLGSGVLFEANHASATIRNAASAGNLGNIGGIAAKFDVPNRTADDLDLAILSRSTTVSLGGATPGVTAYQDRDGLASLLAVGGSGQLLASGGAAPIGVPTSGAYTWEGVQILGEADDLAGLTPGRFTLTTTFSGAATVAFSYTGGTTTAGDGTLTATGDITRATGALRSSTSGFSLAGVTSAAITEGSLVGRLSGAGVTAVSGVFVTTNASGDRYAGGFVGGAPLIVFPTHEFAAAGDDGGFGEAFVRLDAETEQSRVVFVANDLGALETEANVVGDAARAASLIDAIVTTRAFTSTATTRRIVGSTGGDYSYKSGTAGLDLYVAGASDARLFVIDGFAQSAQSVIAHVVKPRTGSFENEAYTWRGVHLWAERASLHDTTEGEFQITATFSATATANFTYTTIGTSRPFTLSGTGTITKSTGRLASTTLSFDADGAGALSSTQTSRLQGAFGGADGESLVGLFATTAGATDYAGGFIGNGKQDVDTILAETTDHVGLGFTIDRNAGPGTADGIALIGDDYDALLATTRGARDSVRGASIIANIAPTGLGSANALAIVAGHPQAFANEKTGGSIAFGAGGTSYAVTAWEDESGTATLLFLNGTGVSNSGSLFIAGGDSRPTASGLTGGYSWEGALVYTARSLHTGQRRSGFRLVADFARGGAGTFAASSASGAISAGVIVDADTGRISTPGAIQVAGTASGGAISGLVSGDGAQAVSGVLTTGSGTIIAGGFVGGAPRVARDLATPSSGVNIGNASRAVFETGASAHNKGRVLFLGANYETRRNALNVVSDASRENALLSNMNTALAGAVSTNNINKYTLSETNKIDYGTAQVTTGVVFEDVSRTARLLALDGFLVAGGTALTATINGQFKYEGVFVSASQTNLADNLREGTFTFIANLVGTDASTHNFTLDAQTAESTDGVIAITSQLNVSTAHGGSINATSGAFSATAGRFINGADTSGGIVALVHGSILGAGGAGVAGLFTTTAGDTVYAGGFAGSVVDLAESHDVSPEYDGHDDAGFATSNRIRIPGGRVAPTVLFADNLEKILEDANSDTQTVSGAAYLARSGAQTGVTLETASSVYGVSGILTASATGAQFKGANIGADVTYDWLGVARYAHVRNTGLPNGNHGPLAIAGGDPLAVSGSGLDGDYTWQGVLIYGDVAAFNTVSRTTTTVTADFDLTTPELTITLAPGVFLGLSGALTVNTETGVLANKTSGSGGALTSALTFGTGSGANLNAEAIFAGRLHGSDAISLAGVFATTGGKVDGKDYAGALLATGAINLPRLAGGGHNATLTTGGPTLAAGNYAINAHPATLRAYVVTPQDSGALLEANHASDDIRGAALVAQLATIGVAGAIYSTYEVERRLSSEIALAIRTRSATVSHDGATPGVTVYQDRTGSASLVVAGGASKLLASSGSTTSAVPATGAFTWEGVHLLGVASDLSDLAAGRFTLTTTFSSAATASFSYTGGTTTASDGTLTVLGDITRASGVLVSGDEDSDFSLAGVADSAITDGKLYGRLSGAGAKAVSGVFITTNATGARYAGGFAGGAPQIVRSTANLTSDDRGFGVANSADEDDSEPDRLVFLSSNINDLLEKANVTSDTARAASLIHSIDVTGSFDRERFGGILAVTSGSYDYSAGVASLDLWVAGVSGVDAILLSITGVDSAKESVLAYIIEPRTGVLAAGNYTWQGVQYEDGGENKGRFQISGALTGGQTSTLKYVTLGDASNRVAVPFSLSGNVTLDPQSGSISGTLDFDPDGGGAATKRDVTLQGEFAGARGTAIAGLFATDIVGATTQYSGGFVGQGPRVEWGLANGVGESGVTEADITLRGASDTSAAVVVAEDISRLLGSINSPNDTERGNTLLANVNPTGLGTDGTDVTSTNTSSVASNLFGLTVRAGGALTHDAKSFAVTSYQDRLANAELLVLAGTGDAASDSAIIATGVDFVAPATSGGGGGFFLTWKGIHFWTGVQGVRAFDATGADGIRAATRTFTITAYFPGSGEGETSTFSYATDGSYGPGSLSGSGTFDKASGRLTSSSSSYFQFNEGGSGRNALLYGRVFGDGGEGVSGVFLAGPNSSGEGGYIGGFLGQGPQIVDIVDKTAGMGRVVFGSESVSRGIVGFQGLRIGIESTEIRGVRFVARNLAAIVNEVNSVSDNKRNAALVNYTQLGTRLTGAPSWGTDTRRRTGTVSYDSDDLAAVSHESWNESARLLLVDATGADTANALIAAGGYNLSNIPTSGAYTWEGIHVYGDRSALQTTTSGAFRIVATFNTSQTNFTYSTRSTGGATLSGTGTIDNTSGALSASTLSFVPGTGVEALTTRLDGQLHASGAQGASGVFATTNDTGTKYSGGFVGAGPANLRKLPVGATAIAGGDGATGTDGAIGTASLTGDVAGSDDQHIVFLANNIDTVVDQANNASDAVRATALVLNLDDALSGSMTFAGNVNRYVADSTTGTPSFGRTAYETKGGTARLLVVDASSAAGHESAIVAAGGSLSNVPTTGTYAFDGTHVWAEATSLETATVGTFRLIIDFGSTTNSAWTYSTTSDVVHGEISGRGGVQTSTGVISTQISTSSSGADPQTGTDPQSGFSLGMNAGGGAVGPKIQLALHGRFNGAGADTVSGIFRSISGVSRTVDRGDGSTPEEIVTHYGGGFVGRAVKHEVNKVVSFTGTGIAGGVATGTLVNRASGSRTPVTFLAPDIDSAVSQTNATTAVTSGVVNQILFADRSGFTAGTKVGEIAVASGTLNVAGTGSALSVYDDSVAGARLFVLKPVSGDDVLLATGATATNIPTTGGFTYEGVLFQGARNGVDNQGTFDLSLNFGTGVVDFDGTVSGHTLEASGTKSGPSGLASGRFTFSDADYTLSGTSVALDATIHAQLHGARATGVSGVWYRGVAASAAVASPATVGAFLGSRGISMLLGFYNIGTTTGEKSGIRFGRVYDSSGKASHVSLVAQQAETHENAVNTVMSNALVINLLEAQSAQPGTSTLDTSTGIERGSGSISLPIPGGVGSGFVIESFFTPGKDARLDVFNDSSYGGTTIIASGAPVSNIPQEGSYTYSGELIGGNGVSALENQRGTFVLTVEFGTGVSFGGVGSGDAIGNFNFEGQRYVSVGSTEPVSYNGNVLPGTGQLIGGTGTDIYGYFHGSGATSVAGVYGFENDSDKVDHFAGFVGTGKANTFWTLNNFGSTTSDLIPGGFGRGTYTPSGSAAREFVFATANLNDTVRDANIGRSGLVFALASFDQSSVTTSPGTGTSVATRITTAISLADGSTGIPATVFEDRAGGVSAAKLYLLNPGTGNDHGVAVSPSLSGTPTGTHIYAGILFGNAPANVGVFSSSNMGTFSVSADFSVAGTVKLSNFRGRFGNHRLTTSPIAGGGVSETPTSVSLGGGRFTLTNVNFFEMLPGEAGAGTGMTLASIWGQFGGVDGTVLTGAWSSSAASYTDPTHVGIFLGNRFRNTVMLSADDADIDIDIDGAGGETHGVAIGDRFYTAVGGSGTVESELVVISPTVASDVSASGTGDSMGKVVVWLDELFETTLTADDNRGDFSGTATSTNPGITHSIGQKSANGEVVRYTTSRSGRDVASMYFRGGDDGYLVVSGPKYGSTTYLQGQLTKSALQYVGRMSTPRKLDSALPANTDTQGFTLALTTVPGQGAIVASGTFTMQRDWTSSDGSTAHKFSITGGKVDYQTGKMSVDGDSTISITDNNTSNGGVQNVFRDNTFGFAGQIYGDEAEALGGVYWGVGRSESVTVDTSGGGKPYGGAFIGTR